MAGAWLSAIVAIAITILTGGIAVLVFSVVFGVRGTWIYYCARVKKQQQIF